MSRGNFGARGGSGRGRGGYSGRGRGAMAQPQGPPSHVLEMGYYLHECEGDMVCRSSNPKIPYFNAPIYLENKQQIGKVDEILGRIEDVYFTVKLQENILAKSFKSKDKVYIAEDKLLPLERFLPKTPVPKVKGPKGKGDRGRGRGGRGRGGRGGSFGGRVHAVDSAVVDVVDVGRLLRPSRLKKNNEQIAEILYTLFDFEISARFLSVSIVYLRLSSNDKLSIRCPLICTIPPEANSQKGKLLLNYNYCSLCEDLDTLNNSIKAINKNKFSTRDGALRLFALSP
ncbi:5185_t:CDS:2 [Paraglomus occultum]|uniref:H/ACA ribonucleoprotein complex subunit n=1 Tax=Paraglomus occultum TaxID=144539 RepID=A0A9N8WEU2_9GLOM|nr:5185_t:CDS:2 [Paraglomus occultum]